MATQIGNGFADLTGTSWNAVASSFIDQLRASGHDLLQVEDSEGVQEWQATWYHPRGTFSLSVAFRAPTSVEVTWKTEAQSFSARAGE